MAHLRFTDVQDRPGEFLDLTSLTLDEFEQLVPPFEAAFRAHMAVAWSRMSSKFIANPPCVLRHAGDRWRMSSVVRMYVYRSRLVKESEKCGGVAAVARLCKSPQPRLARIDQGSSPFDPCDRVPQNAMIQ
jgi:hypothetical protein